VRDSDSKSGEFVLNFDSLVMPQKIVTADDSGGFASETRKFKLVLDLKVTDELSHLLSHEGGELVLDSANSVTMPFPGFLNSGSLQLSREFAIRAGYEDLVVRSLAELHEYGGTLTRTIRSAAHDIELYDVALGSGASVVFAEAKCYKSDVSAGTGAPRQMRACAPGIQVRRFPTMPCTDFAMSANRI
jgi:hypothetical protein